MKSQDDIFCLDICCNLKVVALLMRGQLGYIKFGCFLREWNKMKEKNIM